MQNEPKKWTTRNQIDNSYAMTNVVPFRHHLVSIFRDLVAHTFLPTPLWELFKDSQPPKVFLCMLFGIDTTRTQ